MFYLTMHSIYFIYCYMTSDSERGNPLPPHWLLLPIRSGQVRSKCLTCTFRASCCIARLSRGQVPASQVPLFGTGKKGGGGGVRRTACTGGYKGVRAVRPESVSCGGVMEFGLSRMIKPKEKYVRISMKEIWRKNKELWSYVVSFVFSRPKVAHFPISSKGSFICIIP